MKQWWKFSGINQVALIWRENSWPLQAWFLFYLKIPTFLAFTSLQGLLILRGKVTNTINQAGNRVESLVWSWFCQAKFLLHQYDNFYWMFYSGFSLPFAYVLYNCSHSYGMKMFIVSGTQLFLSPLSPNIFKTVEKRK